MVLIIELPAHTHMSKMTRQLNISNAFLHGFLDTKLYMEQPKGFLDQRKPYYTDHSLFVYTNRPHKLFVLVYVDDILVTGSNSSLIEWFVAKLAATFPVRDLGDIHYFLGIEITQLTDGYLLSQSKYIVELLQATQMLDSKPCRTPMATTPTLSGSIGEVLPSSKEYRQVVGTLQYLTLMRPDIAFAINKLAQFLHCATDIHWQTCKRLLCYLQGTSNSGLWLRPFTTLSIQCYSDSD
ncbi:hypothetical protein K2173_017665 [Erythroxylum novogranatense]|uniref:Reverse transcriptase Ty1/copia-type domain-containing protein n=1 Tax=Erythroxylum novogranatense TaxID=1862640 RepID=A0AAV8SLL1_9ROSI|nr:hypothetical protein K2173_017665 [Erythroxylum novogranatense]